MESDQTTFNSLDSANPSKNNGLSSKDYNNSPLAIDESINEDDNSGVIVDETISSKSIINDTSSQNGDDYFPSESDVPEHDPDSESDQSENAPKSDNNEEDEEYDDGYTNYGLRKSRRNASASHPNQPFQESEDSQDIKPTRRKKHNSDEDYPSDTVKKGQGSDDDEEEGDSFVADSSLDEEEEEMDSSSDAASNGRRQVIKKRRLSSSNSSFNSSDREYYRKAARCKQKGKKSNTSKKAKYRPEQLDGWLRAGKKPRMPDNSGGASGSGSDWDTRNRNRNKSTKSGGGGANNRRAVRKLSSGSSCGDGRGGNQGRLSKSSSEAEVQSKGGKKVVGQAVNTAASRRAVARKTVCYREAISSDEKSDQEGDEQREGEEGAEMEAKETEPAPLVKTIERVLLERIGYPKAVGEMTTSYNVEMYGDPNEDAASKQQGGKKERQYLIKWIGESHLHNTWESMDSLKELGVNGMKKVENFIKNEAETKKWKQHANPEDVEYYYCQKEMADDLLKQYQILERIIAHKTVEKIQESLVSGEREELNASTEIKAESPELPNTYPGQDLKESPLNLGDENRVELITNSVKSEFSMQTSSVVTEQYYLCKWNGLPYAEATWEPAWLVQRKFPEAIDSYHVRRESEKIPYKTCKVLRVRPRFSLLKEQPDYMGDGNRLKLRDYQLDGVNWLARSWCKNNSVILADEMGLGKTIQVISFLTYLFNQHDLYGPFLIIAPLSTIAAWQRETTLWAPHFNAVVYLGDVRSREMIQEYEWHHEGTKRLKFNVILTTYEILLKDKDFLGSYSWALLAVDEAHRLKNEESQFYKVLIEFRTNFRLLVTGTPLQNSLKELWALLHFIMPNRFDSWPEFEASHLGADQSGYTNLHKELEPFILRRVKKDVEKSLPAKVEQILRVGMTSLQRQYYKWILTRNYKALCKGGKGSTSSFLNIVMELKKCCNHCYLTKPEERRPSNVDPLQHLIRGSGKLILLDKLLRRLKETGHRVLIFSQMVRMLDIIAEYLQYRCFTFQRLDGSVRNEVRKQSLDHFNAENSQDFCFLLSTRAGGLGVNLATADTVIIFDSDWNPQNDLQAQARAHRIGQKNQVNIYRFVTKDSIEEDIIQRAKKKMILDHLVIQRMNTTGKLVLAQGTTPASNRTPFNKAELSSILKFGAEDLFKEDRDEEEPQVDIDDILKRAETAEEAPTSLAEELLSQFKVTDFAGIEEAADDMDYSSNTASKKTSKRGKKTKGNSSTTGNANSNASSEKKDYTFNEDSSSSSEYEDDSDVDGDTNVANSRIKLGADSGSEGADSDLSSGDKEKNSLGSKARGVGKEKGWDEIIPKTLREKVEAEERQKEIMKLTLGPRVRKTILYDESQDKKSQQKKAEVSRESSRRSKGSAGVLYKGSKRKRRGEDSVSEAEISPPSGSEMSEGAEEGGFDKKYGGKKKGLGKKNSKSSSTTQVPFNDSEIRRFVKSFRKFPNPQNRLEEVVYDADLQDKPTGDIKILCKLLLNSYRDALALEQKRIEALKNDLAAGNLPSGPVPNASFKINEVVIPLPPFRKSMEDLECLYHCLPPEEDLRARYKLKVPVKTPNWGVPWSLEEDNKLLVGAYNHGIGNWEAIKMNTALGLQNKIMPNNNGKPQAKNLVTRLDYLLKTLKAAGIPRIVEPKADKKKSKQRSMNAFLTSKNEDGITKEGKKERHEEGKGQRGDNETQLTAAFEMPEEIFVMCKEKMRPVKKALKQLDNPDPTLSEHDQLNQTKYCLLTIGDHIQECLAEYKDPEKIKEWRSHLWAFVSKFTEYDPNKLHKVYKHAYRKRLDEAENKNNAGGSSYPHARDSQTNKSSSSHTTTTTNPHSVDSIVSAPNSITAESEPGRASKKTKHYPPADINANRSSSNLRRSSSPTVNNGTKQSHEKQPSKYKETDYSNHEYYHTPMYRRPAYHRDGPQPPQPYEHSRSNRPYPRRGYQNFYRKSSSPPAQTPHINRTEILSPASPTLSPVQKEKNENELAPTATKHCENDSENCDTNDSVPGQSEGVDPNNTSLNCVAEEGEIVGDTSNGSNDTSIPNTNASSNNDPSAENKSSTSYNQRNRRTRRRRYDPTLDLPSPLPTLSGSASGGVDYYPNISPGPIPSSTRPPLGPAPHYYNHRAGSYYYGPSPPTYYHHHNRHRYFDEDNGVPNHPPPLMYEEDYYTPPPGPPLLGPRPLLTPTSSLGGPNSQWSPLDRYRDNDPYYERPSSYPMTYKRR